MLIHRKPERNLGRALVLKKAAGVMLLCLSFNVPFAEAASSDERFEINIEAADAVTALNSLASQTDLPLLFDFDQVRDLRVNAVKGAYTLQAVSYTHLTLPTKA